MSDAPVAIVTGAGSGVGRCASELLGGAGYRIALVGRSEERLEGTMAAVSAHTATAAEMLMVAADVSDARQAASVVQMAVDEWGRVDALVNNAGTAPQESIENTDEDLLYRTFAVNVFGPACLIAGAWPVFRRQRGGCIVNVSSLAAHDPLDGFFAYGASKAALESLTRSAHREGQAFGVRAFTVAPGAIETAMLRRLFSERDLPRSQTLDPRDVAHVICDCILGRRDRDAGTPIELIG